MAAPVYIQVKLQRIEEMEELLEALLAPRVVYSPDKDELQQRVIDELMSISNKMSNLLFNATHETKAPPPPLRPVDKFESYYSAGLPELEERLADVGYLINESIHDILKETAYKAWLARGNEIAI